ncbi:transcription termination factor Rho [Curtanaerobium respiraculi]|uniref:transcription termination factor Rho n=1 Tax=Curtanaerobium respiraculi TaxID=2949669 RepID=UPI0024B37244|nr:transcription termination factor Rho [Curtanaerobium respiraculi]
MAENEEALMVEEKPKCRTPRARKAKPAPETKVDAAAEAPAEPRRSRAKTAAGDDAEPKPAADNDGEQRTAGDAARETATKVRRRRVQPKQQGTQRQDSTAQAGPGGKDRNRGKNRNRHDRNGRNREVSPSVTKDELAALKVVELREKAKELDIDTKGLLKADLIQAVYDAEVKKEGFVEVSGVLDILSDGYGFLRTEGYLPGEHDVYVGTAMIRRSGLRKGDMVSGTTRPPRNNEKFGALQRIASVNGKPVEESFRRPHFKDLMPVYPDERLIMEHGRQSITSRVIDLAAPIGKGQRGLIVSPPKAGKTTVLKQIAASIAANNPEVHLMCLLVDERPEEVTDMERSVKGEVVSSTFDMPSDNHIAVAEMVIERAKRLVEEGKDVVILLDSITRLARAYNLAQPASGRILSGGVDSTALYPPKRFLGAARNIEGGGSLTILASALIDTGSKMDEVIFEEFKGTGNMELKLDRNLADRRIYPAIDPVASGTRKEDLLLNPQEAPLIWAVRRILANMNNTERAMDMLIKSLKQTETNAEFLLRTAKKAQNRRSDDNFEL